MNKLLRELLIIYFYAILFIFLPILVSILIILSHSILFENGILFSLAIILLVIPILATTFFFSVFANLRYIKKVETEYKIKKEYVGVVVTTDKLRFIQYFFIYFSDLMLLIECLKLNNQPYKLLNKFDKKDFDKLVFDQNCRGLYILGHGRKHGLLISKNEMLYYCEYRNAPKKEFIVQMHCNHMKGKSLGNYLCANEEFPTENMRTVSENREYLLSKLKNETNSDAFDIYKSYLLDSLKILLQYLRSIKNKSKH